jgi:ferrochelatase
MKERQDAPAGKDDFAVLLMAYGAPGALDEVEPYLLDVRGGRPLAPALVEEIRDRYRRIGGKSPLLEITRRQASALEEALRTEGYRARVFVGMRHWHPYIKDAIAEIVSGGFRRVVGLCMAPQYSNVSIGAYFRQFETAVRESGTELKTSFVRSWHDNPDLLLAYAKKGTEALLHFAAEDRGATHVLFTAHSLPVSRLSPDDPYDRHQKETAAGVARLLQHEPWGFAYQSQGYTNDEWLGPRVEETLERLYVAGTRDILVIPTGFLCDHVEVLYDVDVVFHDLARSRGMRLERSASLNDDPLLIRALRGLAIRAFGELGSQATS